MSIRWLDVRRMSEFKSLRDAKDYNLLSWDLTKEEATQLVKYWDRQLNQVLVVQTHPAKNINQYSVYTKV